MINRQHVGDGAYVTTDSSDTLYPLIVTANHHDPAMASDKVFFEVRGLQSLLDMIAAEWPGELRNALERSEAKQ